MLEFDDIQHILLTRVRPPSPDDTSSCRFEVRGGRAWLTALERCSRPRSRASVEKEKRWVTVAFTWNGLRALGVDEASLATFPEEFRQGMVARAEILGDTGENHPDNWVGAGQPGTPRHRHPLCPRSCGARAMQGGTRQDLSRGARGWRCSRHWTWRPRRRSTMRTTTSVTAIACRSRSSKGAGRSRRPAPARR